jgi:hypothetical protein
MIRKLLLAGFAAAVLMAFAASTVDAAPISRNNPYAALNIIGINNASLQWEKAHRQGQSQTRSRATHSGGWRLFRRR